MKTLIAFVASCLFASVAVAAPPAVRQARQTTRIAKGVKTGQLTKKEAADLAAQQARIQAKKKKAKADGVVTPAEKRRLDRAQDRASRNIYRKKHNGRTR